MAKCPCCGHEFTDDEAIFIAKSYAGSIKTAKKSAASAENGRKYGGRPKGAKNKAPRSDKGVPRGPRNGTMDDEKIIDPRYIEQFRSLPSAPHDDKQDSAALAPPPTAGILGAVAASLHPGLNEKPHVEIQREPDIFKPTKSMLDFLSERIGSDLNKRLTEFGDKNGYPVVFVFYQTLKNENGVSKATCDIKMYKSYEKQDARLFALKHEGEFGIFDPRSKDEQIKDLEKKVKRLEEDRDHWHREATGRDDGDTLGIFRHWDE